MSRVRIDLLLKLRDYSWDQVGWFLPLAQAIEGLTAAEAAWQPPGGGNTIWQTVNHINFYNERLLARLTKTPFEGVNNNDETFQGPGNPEDTAGWQATLERTNRIAIELRQVLAELTDADLEQKVGNGAHTVGDGLTSWVMHDAHHTGQIVLIRKMQGWKGHHWE